MFEDLELQSTSCPTQMCIILHSETTWTLYGSTFFSQSLFESFFTKIFNDSKCIQ